MEHRRVCFCMLSLLPLVQISKLSQANSLLFGKVCCRTPRGVRGLKLHEGKILCFGVAGRTPRGVRGLKCAMSRTVERMAGRTPRGVRGLKSGVLGHNHPGHWSHPSRGAWIEIKDIAGLQAQTQLSHPSRGAWIEILAITAVSEMDESHPSRGAWIEMPLTVRMLRQARVAPLAGCVD